MKTQKILYIDMDNVLVDFQSGIERLKPEIRKSYGGNLDEVPGIFGLMDPMPGAVEAFKQLSKNFDTYLLSTAPWLNPSAWSDKLEWVHKYLGIDETSNIYKRLILTHHKNLNFGDYLIDDRTANGVSEFMGEHIHFGSKDFPDWKTVLDYLLKSLD